MKAIEWLAIAGPTASGKTDLALWIAERCPAEIISVDSALVYRGMDIGTAKPSAAERAAVPHHLIDILDPDKAYSAADFVRDARLLVKQIRERGRLPLLVGGTMLYFKALWEGLDDMPPAQPALRAAIEAEAQAQGWPALHAALERVDPVTAARLAPNDAQRISRALEVFRATGLPLSSFHRKANPVSAGPEEGLTIDGSPGMLLSLEPQDRGWLHRRIAERFDAMLKAGFLEEVQALRTQPALHTNLPSMRCVGYRQAWEALDRAQQDGRHRLTDDEWAELRERGIAATRQLAKRQLTWLRSMPQRHTVACDHESPQTAAARWIGLSSAGMA